MRRIRLGRAVLLGMPLVGMVSCGPGGPGEDVADTLGVAEAELQSCSTTAAQPAGCYYGQYCGVNAFCEPVAAPTCVNFTMHGTSWNPNTSLGPIIYQSGQIYFGPDSLWCTTGTERVILRLKVYSPSANLPTNRTGLSNWFYYVRTNGTVLDGSQLVNNINTSADRRTMTFDANLCVPAGTSYVSAGFFFGDGNEHCTQALK